MAMTRKLGYEWVYEGQIDLSETNYAPYVLEMKNRGVQFVTFMGAYQQAARLAQAMGQQGFEPDIYNLQSNAYTPDLIQTGGKAVEGITIAVPGTLLEEIDGNKEMQRYAQWLQQVKPGARPTGLGMYAWASAKMFIDAAKKAGPELTRKKLIAELQKIGEYDADGLTAPHHIGKKTPTACAIIVEVNGGKFRRKEPSSGFRCNDLVSF
jgi:ABC-type branched-subunit amino acid transport system substrate-binding protein